MGNTLKIYKTMITPERNARVDAIDEYLSALVPTYTSTDFRYVKPDLDTSIRINRPSSNSDVIESIGNYAMISQSQGSGAVKTFYYFILGSKWISQETIELNLSMDTINTFWSDVTWSDKTSIMRQHMNRYRYTEDVGTTTSSLTIPRLIDRESENINPSELFRYSSFSITQPNTPSNLDQWYLCYQTQADVSSMNGSTAAAQNPVRAYLCSDSSFVAKHVQSGTSAHSFPINSNDMTIDTQYFVLSPSTNVTVSLTGSPVIESSFDQFIYLDGTPLSSANFYKLQGNTADSFTDKSGIVWKCIAVVWKWWYNSTWGDGDDVAIGGIYKNQSSGKYTTGLRYNGVTYVKTGWNKSGYADIEFSTGTNTTTSDIYSNADLSDFNASYWGYGSQLSQNWFPSFHIDLGTTSSFNISTGADVRYNPQKESYSTEAQINSYGLVYQSGEDYYGTVESLKSRRSLSDENLSYLSDPKLIKVIDIPYAPSTITRTGSGTTASPYIYDLGSGFSYVTTDGSLYITDMTSNFSGVLNTVNLIPQSIQTIAASAPVSRATSARQMSNESKLYNSEFYRVKFVYDSNTFEMRLENFFTDPNNINPLTVTPTMTVTNTIGSQICFSFSYNWNHTSETDFDDLLITTRDNSITVYNNDYLNYMRYGYKTEKENLKASTDARNFSIGAGAVSTVASTAAGAVGGFMVGQAAGAVVGAIAGATTGIISTINAVKQADVNLANANRNISAKVAQSSMQSSTVAGTNSAVDIMIKATNGGKLRMMWYEPYPLMQEAIYDKLFYCGYAHPVQDVPVFNSRCWFNFVQCQPVFTDEGTNTYNYYLEDFKARFRIGVTIYHRHPNVCASGISYGYDWEQNLENWESNFTYGIDGSIPSLTMSANTEEMTFYPPTGFAPSLSNSYRYEVQYSSTTNPGVWSTYPGLTGYTTQSYFQPASDWYHYDPGVYTGISIRVRIVDISKSYSASAWDEEAIGDL